MPKKLYFAYGSNLDADQMRLRCPSSTPGFRACLDYHRLDFTHYSMRWQGGAADVVADSETQVWGFVYALAESDLMLLDVFESGYNRQLFEVRDDLGRLHTVTSYSVREKRNFTPSEIYLNRMLRWGAHWGLPSDYLERIRRFR